MAGLSRRLNAFLSSAISEKRLFIQSGSSTQYIRLTPLIAARAPAAPSFSPPAGSRSRHPRWPSTALRPETATRPSRSANPSANASRNSPASATAARPRRARRRPGSSWPWRRSAVSRRRSCSRSRSVANCRRRSMRCAPGSARRWPSATQSTASNQRLWRGRRSRPPACSSRARRRRPQRHAAGGLRRAERSGGRTRHRHRRPRLAGAAAGRSPSADDAAAQATGRDGGPARAGCRDVVRADGGDVRERRPRRRHADRHGEEDAFRRGRPARHADRLVEVVRRSRRSAPASTS